MACFTVICIWGESGWVAVVPVLIVSGGQFSSFCFVVFRCAVNTVTQQAVSPLALANYWEQTANYKERAQQGVR